VTTRYRSARVYVCGVHGCVGHGVVVVRVRVAAWGVGSLTGCGPLCVCGLVRVHARARAHQLLELLQQFSQSFETRSRALLESLNGLSFDAKATEVSYDNVLNKFLLLSNTQFVENVRRSRVLVVQCVRDMTGGWCWCECAQRVFEEEDVDANPEEASDTKQAPEPAVPVSAEDMQANFKLAISCGSKALHFYQTFDEEGQLENPDSENAFDGLPLPFVIGTREWMTDETLGLGVCTSHAHVFTRTRPSICSKPSFVSQLHPARTFDLTFGSVCVGVWACGRVGVWVCVCSVDDCDSGRGGVRCANR